MGPVPLAPNFHLVHNASDQDISPCEKVCVCVCVCVVCVCVEGDMLVNVLVHGSDSIW